MSIVMSHHFLDLLIILFPVLLLLLEARVQFLPAEMEESEAVRAEAHRNLARALTADRAQLNDALRDQKRAQLRAQLAESKQVEEALAAAPEYLRYVP